MARKIRDGAEEMGKLYGDGDFQIFPQLPHQRAIILFHFRRAARRVRHQRINIQFDRVRAGLFHFARVAHPAARRDAIQAGDDGNRDGFFRPANQFQIAVRTQIVIRQFRKKAGRFREGFRAAGQIRVHGFTVENQLLLKQATAKRRRRCRDPREGRSCPPNRTAAKPMQRSDFSIVRPM